MNLVLELEDALRELLRQAEKHSVEVGPNLEWLSAIHYATKVLEHVEKEGRP